ncbi:MAG TPA: CopG family transcriptional regulator [Thermoanaerobaculia bacterium]|nr:CopG family transcriptional regulator [Thermoanaerobaculia bacterium]
MPKRERPEKREPTKGKLYREVAYLHQDEAEAVERAARKDRTSRSEVIRRAVRAYFKIED